MQPNNLDPRGGQDQNAPQNVPNNSVNPNQPAAPPLGNPPQSQPIGQNNQPAAGPSPTDPKILPKRIFIQGYSFKFYLIALLVIVIGGGIWYFNTHPLPDFLTTMADSIKAGLFKSSSSEYSNPGQSTTNAREVQSGTTGQTGSQTLTSVSTTAVTTTSATTTDDANTGEIDNPEKSSTATSCVTAGNLLIDPVTHVRGVCCSGLRIVPIKLSPTGDLQVKTFAYYCMY